MKFYRVFILLVSLVLFNTTSAAESNIDTKIVGGVESVSGEWPWMVLLSSSSISNGSIPGFFCGGSLISDEWILTAAHCVVDSSPSNVFAFVGEHDKSTPDIAAATISEIIVHPQYNPNTSDNDLAIIKLSSPSSVTPVNIISPALAAALETEADDPINDLTVIGWGNTEAPDPTYPNVLRDVDLPYVSNTVCNSSGNLSGQITTNMMCAGLQAGGIDSCQGDSGGPLVYSNAGNWYQAGVVSWGIGCADPNNYGVYTRVENYINWIQLAINGVTPSLTFGTWIDGKTANAQIEINNSTNGSSYSISSITSSNPSFTIGTDTCPVTINPGDSCVINLNFSSAIIGSHSGTITLTTNHPDLGVATVEVLGNIATLATYNNVEADAEIEWASTGNNLWSEQLVTVGGTYSLQSGNISNSQQSSLFAYVNIAAGNSTRDVYFDWRSCSEPGWDYLELWIDGVKVDARSGNADWARKFVTLNGEGDHVIEWRFNKDYLYGVVGVEAGWVDNIELDAASLNTVPVHIGSCDLTLTGVPPAGGGGGGGSSSDDSSSFSLGAMSSWFYLALGIPLLMRRRHKI